MAVVANGTFETVSVPNGPFEASPLSRTARSGHRIPRVLAGRCAPGARKAGLTRLHPPPPISHWKHCHALKPAFSSCIRWLDSAGALILPSSALATTMFWQCATIEMAMNFSAKNRCALV
jgi:hypothetical protein